VSIREQFVVEVAERYGRVAGPELLPLVLVEVCAKVLSVDGAGLSLTGELRVPMAASNHLAARAERLQSTLGDGPCLAAAADATPLVAETGVIGNRWPMFHRELTSQTPFRSVASIPLREPRRSVFGALDLYSTAPDAVQLHSIAADSTALADQIAVTLLAAPSVDEDGDLAYTWMSAAAAAARRNVWIAIGMLLAHSRRLNNHDALSILRGYALTHHTSLDDLADDITERRIAPDDILHKG